MDKHDKAKHSAIITVYKNSFQIAKDNNEIIYERNSMLSRDDISEINEKLKELTSSSEKISIHLKLDSNLTLARNISLPSNTEENLYEVIQYEMDRYTPFPASEIYFDYKLLERLDAKGLIRVLLVVVKRESLEVIKEIVESNDNFLLSNVDIVNSDNPKKSVNDVKFLSPFIGKDKSRKSFTKKLVVIAAGLLLLASITPLILNYIHIYQLSKELEQLQPTVQKVKKLQNDYQKVLDHVEYLVKIKEKNPSIIELINTLTKVLPDHTHIQRLTLEGGLLSLQGLSASTSDLIPIIDEIGLFEDIRFAAPVTQNRSDNSERFTITAKLSTYKVN